MMISYRKKKIQIDIKYLNLLHSNTVQWAVGGMIYTDPKH